MSLAEFEKKLLADRLGLSEQEFEDHFAALCRRLGISGSATTFSIWSEVAFRLIKQQPEFKKPKRGRPALGRFGRNKDYQRYLVVNALRRQKEAAGVSRRITDKALIKELFDSGHELFRDLKGDATQSVSDGKQIFKQAQEELRRLEKKNQKLEAARKRQEAEFRRQQERHEKEMRRGLLSWAVPDTNSENSG